MIVNNDCTMDYELSDGQTNGATYHTIAIAVNDVIVDSCDGSKTLKGTKSLNAGDRVTLKIKTSNGSRVGIKGSVSFY